MRARPQAAPFSVMGKIDNHIANIVLLTEFDGLSREAPSNHEWIPERLEIQAVAEPIRKRRGEAAEAAFLARATHLGFSVCLPWGDSERYDSVVDLGHGFLRVQVKSAARCAETRYRVKTTGSKPSANGKALASILKPVTNPTDTSKNTAKPGASSPAPRKPAAGETFPSSADVKTSPSAAPSAPIELRNVGRTLLSVAFDFVLVLNLLPQDPVHPAIEKRSVWPVQWSAPATVPAHCRVCRPWIRSLSRSVGNTLGLALSLVRRIPGVTDRLAVRSGAGIDFCGRAG